MSNGLYFWVNDLVYAMGIDKAIVMADVHSGALRTFDGRVDYMDAINYNHRKSKEGIDMYDPKGFESRLLAIINGYIAKNGEYK